MELRKKEDIIAKELFSHKEFFNEFDFVKGYFTNLSTINNNTDFLEYYRYVQYWELPIPQILIDYALIPNYSPISLLSNLKLTGDDTYFQTIKEMICNKDNKYKVIHTTLDDNFEIDEENMEIKNLVLRKRPDLTTEYMMRGCVPKDLYSSSKDGNVTLEIIKSMMSESYIPSDDIIIWYIIKGMGGVAKQCITEYSDIDFIFEEIPIDMDSFQIIYSNKELSPEKAEEIIFQLIKSSEDVDVALFLMVYDIAKSLLTTASKLNLLNQIINKNEKFLIYEYLKVLDEEYFDKAKIENLIINKEKSIVAYVIYALQILNENNYDAVYDTCFNIDTDEKVIYYYPSDDECGDVEDSSSDSCLEFEYDSDFENREDTDLTKYYLQEDLMDAFENEEESDEE